MSVSTMMTAFLATVSDKELAALGLARATLEPTAKRRPGRPKTTKVVAPKTAEVPMVVSNSVIAPAPKEMASIESAPKERKKVDHTGQVLELNSDKVDGKDVLRLKEPDYNYQFAKGWYYANVVKPMQDGTREKKTGWKWDPVSKERIIPREDFELLMVGLHSTWSGAVLRMPDQSVVLGTV